MSVTFTPGEMERIAQVLVGAIRNLDDAVSRGNELEDELSRVLEILYELGIRN